MRGGARVGAGKKPQLAMVTGRAATVAIPADLSDAERAIWEDWAPLALGAGTLTPQTVPAFRLLCACQARCLAYLGRVREDGETFFKVTVDGSGQEQRELKAHPLIAKADGLAYRVEQLLARFSLAPTGRPLQHPAKKAGKWEAFGISSAS